MYAGFGQAEVLKLNMPPCYSKEFHECRFADNPSESDYPGCAAWDDAFNANEAATEALIDAMPYCSEKDRYYWAGGGVLAGILVGSLLATLTF